MIISLTYEENGNRRRWFMRRGEIAILGNSPWCDFVLPDLEEPANVSCTLLYQAQPAIQANPESSLIYQATPIQSKTLESGDTFQLDRYTFHVTLIGPANETSLQAESGRKAGCDTSPDSVPQEKTSPWWFDYTSVPDQVLMSELGRRVYLSTNEPKTAIDQLVNSELMEDAVRALAGMLPLLERIRWCFDSLDRSQFPISETHRSILVHWLANPQSCSQREIANTVPWNDNRNPWTHLLAAISWIHPNDSPPQSWCPPSTAQMVVASVIAAMQLATAHTDALPFRMDCIDRGIKLLQKECIAVTTEGAC